MNFDTSLSKEILGLEYRPIKGTLKDMVDSLIQSGYITDKTLKKNWYLFQKLMKKISTILFYMQF